MNNLFWCVEQDLNPRCRVLERHLRVKGGKEHLNWAFNWTGKSTLTMIVWKYHSEISTSTDSKLQLILDWVEVRASRLFFLTQTVQKIRSLWSNIVSGPCFLLVAKCRARLMKYWDSCLLISSAQLFSWECLLFFFSAIIFYFLFLRFFFVTTFPSLDSH